MSSPGWLCLQYPSLPVHPRECSLSQGSVLDSSNKDDKLWPENSSLIQIPCSLGLLCVCEGALEVSAPVVSVLRKGGQSSLLLQEPAFPIACFIFSFSFIKRIRVTFIFLSSF